MSRADFSACFPKRKPASHKGDYGKAFILAGSEGMLGAALLCGMGALRVGAGIVYMGVPAKSKNSTNFALPEAIAVGGENAKDYLTAMQKTDAAAIGPGLGWRRNIAHDLLFNLSDQGFSAPVVLDADGINAFVNDLSALEKLKLNLILTPHPGEMARLLGKRTEEVQKEREKVAKNVAKLFNCVVVLKGHETIVADSTGQAYINKTGNPGMAKGGMGDVLTGMIAGLAAQGRSPWEAATTGVYLHGLAGDLAAKEKGEYGMIATDLIGQIPYAICSIN
jgi:NAD(P)H-hydrate epimerase